MPSGCYVPVILFILFILSNTVAAALTIGPPLAGLAPLERATFVIPHE